MRFALLLFCLVLAAPERKPVLVELFTSEGCSSCPPADRLLMQLESAQVIVLSEHVDYWNSLGWRDPFSSHQFSLRQEQYVRAFHLDGNYTPQMVVDGRTEFVGGNAAKAHNAIAGAAEKPKADVNLQWHEGKLTVHVAHVPSGANWKVLVAVTEGGLHSSVAAGENSGRTLGHTAVVRWLREAGSVRDGAFQGDVEIVRAKNWNPEHLQAVAFVQNAATREIAGVGATALK